MLNFGSRRVFLCDFSSFAHIGCETDCGSYVLLLLADEKSEFEASLAVAVAVAFEAAGAGCREICCMGYVSAELEDAFGAALELQGGRAWLRPDSLKAMKPWSTFCLRREGLSRGWIWSRR